MDPYLAYTAGFEYTFYSPLRQNQDLGAILELIGDTDAGKDEADLEGFRPFRSMSSPGCDTPSTRRPTGRCWPGPSSTTSRPMSSTAPNTPSVSSTAWPLKAEVSGVSARSSSQFRPFQQAARVAAEAEIPFLTGPDTPHHPRTP